MNTNAFRNPQRFERFAGALTRNQLMEDLAAISRRRRGAALATAIRCGAPGYLDILAAESSDGAFQDASLFQKYVLQRAVEIGIEALRAEFFGGVVPRFRPAPMAEIGAFLLWTADEVETIEIGEFLLELALPLISNKLSSSKGLRRVLITNYIYRGKIDEAQSWIKSSRDLGADFLLSAEVNCIARTPGSKRYSGESPSEDEFTKAINKSYCNDAPSKIVFDEASNGFIWEGGNQKVKQVNVADVSFAVLVHAPHGANSSAIQRTIDSILRQLIPPRRIYVFVENAEYKQFPFQGSTQTEIEVVECLDGLASAKLRELRETSEFEYFLCLYTGDLLRPEATQYLLANLREKSSSSIQFQALKFDETLRIDLWDTIIGLPREIRIIASREMLARIGGLVGISPFSINEAVDRLKTVTNGSVEDASITAVISHHTSIDRANELPTKMRDWRRFQSAYQEVHSRSDLGEIDIRDENGGLNLKLSDALSVVKRSAPPSLEVIIAGDWRKYGGPQKSMIEEIKALLKFGVKVGVMHLEASRFIETKNLVLNKVIQGMINRREVVEVNYDDCVTTELLVLRYPPILQVMPTRSSSLVVKKMFILANQAPSEHDGQDIRYLVRECLEAAKQKFTENVSWVPQGPQVREAIVPYLSDSELEDFNLPGIVDPAEWSGVFPRTEFANKPIVGRHSRDNIMKWPEDPAVLRQVYPLDGSFDVRLMGGARTPSSILGLEHTPEAWISHPKDQMPVRDFLAGLEYFVFYQNSNAIEAFGRAILEAIASNLVVILPPHYEPVFGQAAVYARASDVTTVIESFVRDPERYRSQQQIAHDILNREFTHEAYVRRINEVLSTLI